jgi:alkyldihydroxyacetonephosphate synthase
MQAVIANGGMINEHHGVGLKLPLHAPAVWRLPGLSCSLKKTIDPNGIMNPGKTGF